MALLPCWSPGHEAMDMIGSLDECMGPTGPTFGVHQQFHQVLCQDHRMEYELEDALVLESIGFVLRELLEERPAALKHLLGSVDLI